MAYFDQAPFDIRCEWGVAALNSVATSAAIVVVDVLSFTTCVDVAVGRGASVYPYPSRAESAAAFAADHGAILAGRRARDAYSLSPASLLDAQDGLRLVLPSPNGAAIAHAASARGPQVLAGCLRNAGAVASGAQRLGGPITLVMAGERWPDGSLRPAVEDLLGAGAIIARLDGSRSPEAAVAVAAFEAVASRLSETIAACSSGRELVELGFEQDVEIASAMDVSRSIPVLSDGAFVDRS